jgi:hypothetical protein
VTDFETAVLAQLDVATSVMLTVAVVLVIWAGLSIARLVWR